MKLIPQSFTVDGISDRVTSLLSAIMGNLKTRSTSRYGAPPRYLLVVEVQKRMGTMASTHLTLTLIRGTVD